jgi:biopolymer transport protein ExbB
MQKTTKQINSASKTARMAAILSLLLLALTATPARAWWDANWSMRRQITIDAGAKDAGLSGQIGGAAVLLRLHDGNFQFAAAAEDGSDIRFVAADDKTPLKFHIEKFDSLLSEAFVWVRVPEVKPGEKTTFWLYYGNTKGKGERADDPKGTYDDDTVLVYHFAESGTPANDSSGHSNTAEKAGTASAGAMIGGGLRLTGNAPVTIPPNSSLDWAKGAPLTWSAWIKPSALQPNAVIFNRRDGANALVIGLDNGVPFVEVAESGATQRAKGASPLAPNAWAHLAVVAGDGKITIFAGGESAGSASVSIPELKSAMQIGGGGPDEAGVTGFNGEIDELQIAKAARGAAAIKLAAITQGGDKAATVLTTGEDEAPKSIFSFMHQGYVGVIIDSLTVDGWIVIGLLAVMMVVSWWVMIGKAVYLNGIAKANALFLDEWRHVATDLAVLDHEDDAHAKNMGGRVDDEKQRTMRNSSVYRIYHIGVEEIRLRIAADKARGLTKQGLPGRSIQAIRASLDGGLVREQQRLNSKMVLLTIAISGGPFLGLLGTVVGVMITFAAVAEAGDVNVNAIAPGIAAALAATVAGLAVAIPSLFGYNYLLTRVKEATSDMHVFIDEFITKAGEFYREASE